MNPFQTLTPPEPEVTTWNGSLTTCPGDNLMATMRRAYYEALREGHRVLRIRAGIVAICLYESLLDDAGSAETTRYKTAVVELDRALPDDEMALDAQPGGSRYQCVAKIVGIS